MGWWGVHACVGGFSPIDHAACNNDLELIQLLLEYGADLVQCTTISSLSIMSGRVIFLTLFSVTVMLIRCEKTISLWRLVVTL